MSRAPSKPRAGALTPASVQAYFEDHDLSEFDSEDDDEVKAAIRAITGLQRVSEALVEEFRELLDEVAESEADEANAEADEGDEMAADDDGDEGRSVVKKKYKTQYRPFHHRNGDDIGARLTKAVSNAKGQTDPDKLFAFAQANGLWNERYASLNVGMRRMNIGNRARAKLKKGGAIVWPK